MAAVSACSNLHYLEADCIDEQYRVLQVLSDDLHYASTILKYKVYDVESRSFTVRKAAKEANATDLYSGRGLANVQNEEKWRVNQMLKNNAMMLDLAEQVKIGLKTLIEIVCATPGAVQADLKANNDLREGDIEIDSDAISIKKASLGPPLEDQSAKGLTQARHIFVDSSRFVPVNFREASTPVQGEVHSNKCKIDKPRQVKKVCFVEDAAMSKCQAATKALYSIVEPLGHRDDPQCSTNKVFSHVEIPDRLTAKKRKENAERAHSPAQPCNMEQMEKQLHAWIPNKITMPCLPVDRDLQGLMTPNAERIQRDWAYGPKTVGMD
ncbi:hypothetical protein G647_03790 [Cladophialophora carrionii CBS 160.54]|uniref:Uncharacterized protein n=1 Tax=Cladophialophora carrionii CBS 160.54 TaxID=1279043 RepID=V9DCM2_9EURO|nr:uncharacterized protein G647_03790 [Cladophialophora carrionii CBS 160.54]ETI24421.1 hypothetical protein G647_03790 [Cladophialophora carrionii CBS 160.54]